MMLSLLAPLQGCDMQELGDGAMVGSDWPARAPGERPNIILIVLDTARADRMSYNGYSRLTTPNIDRFARDGVIYKNAHSVAPWTLPSHVSMFTGLLPGQHGVTWSAFSEPADMEYEDILSRTIELPDPENVLTTRLKNLGYTTLGFSSNAWVSRRTGFQAGFDAFHEMWKQNERPRLGYRWLPPRLRTIGWLPWGVETLSEVDESDAGLVLRQFDQHALRNGEMKEPFFLFFNFIDPHFPYSPPTLWRYLYSNDTKLGEEIARFEYNEMAMSAGTQPFDVSRFNPFYDAELSYSDFSVGYLLTQLRQNNFYDDAMVVIVSDHGEFIGEDNQFSHQFSVAEELLHIPLVIKYPGNEHAGSTVSDPRVSNLDIYETIIRAAGGQASSPERPSRSLRDMDRFDRSHSIAESYYSEAFLRLNAKWKSFDIDRNRVVRRAVYNRDSKIVFEERTGENKLVAAIGPATVSAIEDARRALEQVLRSAAVDGPRFQDQPLDEDTLKRLRSLGYAQ